MVAIIIGDVNTKGFGFGYMRLPTKRFGKIDYDQLFKMVDLFIDEGFNYFDTAYGYHGGKSEIALKKSVVERYPRENVLIADKLPIYQSRPSDNLYDYLEEQKKRCGVDYFDYYLLHDITNNYYEGICKKLDAFSFMEKIKEEGHVNHIGFSFHDDADTLDKVLKEHPEIEFVQLQINYLDWRNPRIQSQKCYEVARKYGKDIFVMEPLKGGTLVNVSREAEREFKSINPNMSIASWGNRFAASLDGVKMVLSGMSAYEHTVDNISHMKDFKPLSSQEFKVIQKVRRIIEGSITIPCTSCDYCLDACSRDIPISKYLALYNEAMKNWDSQKDYTSLYKNYSTQNVSIASCIECGECEKACTQHINIIDSLKDVSEFFEVD